MTRRVVYPVPLRYPSQFVRMDNPSPNERASALQRSQTSSGAPHSKLDDGWNIMMAVDVISEAKHFIEDAMTSELEPFLKAALGALDRQITSLEHKITPGNKQKDIEERRLTTEFVKGYGPITNKAKFKRDFNKSQKDHGQKYVPSDKTLDRHLEKLGFEGKPGRKREKES